MHALLASASPFFPTFVGRGRFSHGTMALDSDGFKGDDSDRLNTASEDCFGAGFDVAVVQADSR